VNLVVSVLPFFGEDCEPRDECAAFLWGEDCLSLGRIVNLVVSVLPFFGEDCEPPSECAAFLWGGL